MPAVSTVVSQAIALDIKACAGNSEPALCSCACEGTGKKHFSQRVAVIQIHGEYKVIIQQQHRLPA